jgi:hypothetical protein
MKLTSVDELKEYIDKNFDKLSNNAYCQIVLHTIGLVSNKPKNKQLAKEQIDEYLRKWGHLNYIDRPFFLRYD